MLKSRPSSVNFYNLLSRVDVYPLARRVLERDRDAA